MLIITNNVNNYFAEKLDPLDYPYPVKAYVVGILSKYKHASPDYSNQSLTLVYNDAKNNMDFATFQNLGDWIFFSISILPASLQGATKDYYYTLARFSYFYCYRLIHKQIDIYERLADDFIPLTLKTQKLIQNI